MHQKMTELRPSICEIGAKKKGPAAIPAKAAEFYIMLKGSTIVCRNNLTYRVCFLGFTFMVELLLIAKIELCG